MTPANVDYAKEPSDKILGIDDLVEVIIEYIHHLGNHNVAYVQTRILLLASEFNIDFRWPVVGERRSESMLEGLLYGDNPIPRKILPFDGYSFLEGPPEEYVDIHSYFAIRQIEVRLYDETYSNFIDLQKRYLTLFFEHLLSREMLNKRFLLTELILKGLPAKEEPEPWDENW